jgi:transposase-like protein
MPDISTLEQYATHMGPRGTMRRMNAYSEDLRKKIVEALERDATKSEAARAFGESGSWVKRYAELARDGLPPAPKKAPGLESKKGRWVRQNATSSQGQPGGLWSPERPLRRAAGVRGRDGR